MSRTYRTYRTYGKKKGFAAYLRRPKHIGALRASAAAKADKDPPQKHKPPTHWDDLQIAALSELSRYKK